MFLPLSRVSLIYLGLFVLGVVRLHAQESTPAERAPVAPQPANLEYPDNTRGLERLAKDILKAQKENHASRALELAESMVLPDPATWYLHTFGPDIASDEGAKYNADKKNLPAEILKFFFAAIQNQFTDVIAARFEDSCDDNAGENAFGTLQLRLQPVPLYELRFRNGDHFLRLFTIAYVDGGFRYALAPRVSDHFPYHDRATGTLKAPTRAAEPGSSNQDKKPIRIGGNVQAARALRKVRPEYPEVARREHLQGTVSMHAIIDKDGSISNLVVLKGYCSLAKASIEAVKNWRYSPTLFNGEPVQVDTTIDVIFALNY